MGSDGTVTGVTGSCGVFELSGCVVSVDIVLSEVESVISEVFGAVFSPEGEVSTAGDVVSEAGGSD